MLGLDQIQGWRGGIQHRPDVPILAPVPGDKSLLKPGAAVFLAGPKGEDGSVTANFMYVEKDGIKPLM